MVKGDVMVHDKMTLAVKSFFPMLKRYRLRIQGTSMWPSLKNEQLVDISYSVPHLKPGMCYAFLFKKQLWVHRFVTMNNGMAVFIGDRSKSVETVPLDCVLGEVDMRHNSFVLWMINAINRVYFRFCNSFKKLKSLRIALIFLLTIGVHYVGKI
jgi:hypothetical protein